MYNSIYLKHCEFKSDFVQSTGSIAVCGGGSHTAPAGWVIRLTQAGVLEMLVWVPSSSGKLNRNNNELY